MQITGNLAISQGEAPWRDFHSRMTREDRAQPVLALRRHRLRKRYAAIAIAIALPAMAGATDWGNVTAASDQVPSNEFVQFATSQTIPGHDTRASSSFQADTPGAAFAPGTTARAFMAAGSWLDRARAEKCLTMAIYYEAGTQSDDGQRAVAQVVLNRVAHPSFPKTVCGVVFQGSERSTGCQFTFACDGSLARTPEPRWWDRARRVAEQALAGTVFAPVGLATHYHTLDVHPAWDNAMERVVTIGAHAFYRWPGPAGEKAAFHLAYSGGEPMAAPYAKLPTPEASSADDPLALARAYVATLPPATAPSEGRVEVKVANATSTAPRPVYSEAIEARGGDALFRGGNLPAGGTLSPELQRSGEWLQRP